MVFFDLRFDSNPLVFSVDFDRVDINVAASTKGSLDEIINIELENDRRNDKPDRDTNLKLTIDSFCPDELRFSSIENFVMRFLEQ